jgi:two pore calcium channel protein 1
VFLIEALLRVVGLGWTEYISSGWNFFDLSVTLVALIGSLLLLVRPNLTVVVILRPLRLLRLFKLKKRYRDIFGTLVLLSPLMWSTAIVMMVMYYFFAIIGMELFSKYDLRNCCENTTVEDFYKYSANSSSAIGYYYLNNFSNLLISGVTLFELTVVNNWFIVMDAYASVAHPSSRIFFMLFYLFTMVVLTIVVASVLEAFRFRIQYKKQTSKRDGWFWRD